MGLSSSATILCDIKGGKGTLNFVKVRHKSIEDFLNFALDFYDKYIETPEKV